MVYRRLTDRQGAVVRVLCAGKTDREIATEFGIALASVRQHRLQALRRLGRIPLADLCRIVEEDAAPLGLGSRDADNR